MADLKSLRKKIDNIDAAIIKKLAMREKLSRKIGVIKAESSKAIADPVREARQKKQYQQLCLDHQINFPYINRLFKLILTHSKTVQK